MLYIADVLFQGTDALHVTAHFARPRGILVVAQPSNHQGLQRTSWLISPTAAQRYITIYRSTYERYRHDVKSHT